MRVVQSVSCRNELYIPPSISRLIPAEKQNRDTQRIKGIERSKRLTATLRPQLSHLRMARTQDLSALWVIECWPEVREHSDRLGNIILLLLGIGDSHHCPNSSVNSTSHFTVYHYVG